METCPDCGAAVQAGAAWCGQCYATRQRPPAVAFGTRPDPSTTLPPAAPVRSRWRKTQTTFGPVGRVVATLCLVLPFLFLVVTGVIGDPFTLGGAVVWGVVLMPWGLRDVWKAGQLPAG